MIRCPVCQLPTGFYKAEQEDGSIVDISHPLYQRSYPENKKEYISARCGRCFDKANKKKQ